MTSAFLDLPIVEGDKCTMDARTPAEACIDARACAIAIHLP